MRPRNGAGPANSSKRKREKAIRGILKKHRDEDSNDSPPPPDRRTQEEQPIETVKRKAQKYEPGLKENKDNPGKRKTVLQGNITDNDTAQLKSSQAIIQGYNALAISDDKHPVIVCAAPTGKNDERPSLIAMVKKTRARFEEDAFKTAKLTGDSGFCDEANRNYRAENGSAGDITDLRFGKAR